MFVLHIWVAAIQTHSVGIFCQTHFFVVLPKPGVWWQKHVVLETMRKMERECCPLWIGMCPLAQVTKLNSTRAPSEKKTCHSEIPGDALCEPFIISLSHICLLAYSRLSDAQSGGCRWKTSVHFKSNESHLLICRVASFIITFNHSYYCWTCSVMTHFVMKTQQFS